MSGFAGANKQAYPSNDTNGVTRREWYAAKAMQGMIGRLTVPTATGMIQVEDANVIQSFAMTAFAVADAMLAEAAK